MPWPSPRRCLPASLPSFLLQVRLGPGGVEEFLPLGPLSAFEQVGVLCFVSLVLSVCLYRVLGACCLPALE